MEIYRPSCTAECARCVLKCVPLPLDRPTALPAPGTARIAPGRCCQVRSGSPSVPDEHAGAMSQPSGRGPCWSLDARIPCHETAAPNVISVRTASPGFNPARGAPWE